MKRLLSTLLVLPTVMLLVCSMAWGADVYYSVGQNTSNHSSGGNVTISGSAATFDTPQTAVNLGVGDKLTYGGHECYLVSKTSTTVWSVVTALGAAVADHESTTVDSIAHSFASLSAAEAGASGAEYINNTSLVAADVNLNIPCYYDSASDSTPVTVSGWTTDADHKIRIYTPRGGSESNTSQRHTGKWTDTAYKMEFTTSGFLLNIAQSYVVIDGLQAFKTNEPTALTALYNVAGTSLVTTVSNCIAKGVVGTYSQHLAGFYAVGTGTVYFRNCLAYDCYGSPSGNVYGYGFSYNNSGVTAYTYNCTAIGCRRGFNNYSQALAVFKNCLAQSNGNGFYSTTSNIGDSTNNLSDLPDDDIGTNYHYNTVTFVDAANQDFHLASNDAGAKDVGTDLSADSILPFSTDIDNQTRPGMWDIGADEYIAGNITYYRDSDEDTYGDSATTTQSSSGPPSGYVADSTDCNDANAAVHPGAPDAYLNGIDNNCNGQTDEEYAPITEECMAWLGAWAFTYSDTGYQKVVITSVCGDNDPCMAEAWTCGASGTRLSDGQAVSLRGYSMFPGDTLYYEVANPDLSSPMDAMIGHNVPPYVSFMLNPVQVGYGDPVVDFTLLSGVKRTAKDFNKDGKADIVSYDGAGNVEIRKMSGRTIDSTSTVVGIDGTQKWTGNFNGDNSTDILALNGSLYTMYLMDTTVIQSSGAILNATLNGTVVGIADLNGDGKDDIITRNAGGRVYAYLMNGSTCTSNANIYTEGNLAWQIVGAADFNGDGKADILYRNNTTGQLWILQMNGLSIIARGSVYREPNLAWEVVAAADFNGDGKADILYRNTTTDQVWMLMMNGLTISSRGSVYYESADYTILK